MIRIFTVSAGSLIACAALAIAPALSQSNDKPSLTIHMNGSLFDPQNASIKAGQSVLFVNDDSITHDVDDTAQDIKSGDIAAKKSWTYTFNEPGDYHFVCTYHSWMKGEITVTK